MAAASTSPPPFLTGTAISVWQNAGGNNCNWSDFIKNEPWYKILRVSSGDYINKHGKGSDFWTNYRDHLALAKSIGSNSFRLSLEWHRIEPVQGNYSPDAVKKYHDILTTCRELGMVPLITLYHFVEPSWFTDKGGFDHAANISLFVKYALTMIHEYRRYTPLFITFNEPTVKSFFGYLVGNHPPGRVLNFHGAATMIKHQLMAHIEVYERCKGRLGRGESEMTGGGGGGGLEEGEEVTTTTGKKKRQVASKSQSQATTTLSNDNNNDDTTPPTHHPLYHPPRHTSDIQLGLVHNWFEYHPLGQGLHYTCANYLSELTTNCWGNRMMIDFFKTGKFHYKMPYGSDVMETLYDGPPPLDFIGLNYYSRMIFHWTLMPTVRPGQFMTDMHYPMDAEGMYLAIKDVSRIGKPIYITETGIATRNESHRRACYREYTASVVKAIQEGHDVRGLMWWTLVSNFEWDQGFKMDFGLFQWSTDHPVVRKREGSDEVEALFAQLRRVWLERKKKEGEGVEGGGGARSSEKNKLSHRKSTTMAAAAL